MDHFGRFEAREENLSVSHGPYSSERQKWKKSISLDCF